MILVEPSCLPEREHPSVCLSAGWTLISSTLLLFYLQNVSNLAKVKRVSGHIRP